MILLLIPLGMGEKKKRGERRQLRGSELLAELKPKQTRIPKGPTIGAID